MVNHSRSWTPILTHAYFVLKVFFVVQSLSHVQLFATPQTTACQAPLSSTISQSLLKFVSIESVMLSNHFILAIHFSFCLQSSLASGSFLMSQLFPSGDQNPGASALASVLPMNIHGWCPLGLIDLFSLLSKGLSRVSKTLKSLLQHRSSKASILQCSPFFMVYLSHQYMIAPIKP